MRNMSKAPRCCVYHISSCQSDGTKIVLKGRSIHSFELLEGVMPVNCKYIPGETTR